MVFIWLDSVAINIAGSPVSHGVSCTVSSSTFVVTSGLITQVMSMSLGLLIDCLSCSVGTCKNAVPLAFSGSFSSTAAAAGSAVRSATNKCQSAS